MRKLLRRRSKAAAQPPETGGRITNETVAEHREQVLAGGRKFKYPLQYTKHRLLIISLVLVVSAILLFSGFCTWQLYGLQSTDRFMYRLTQIVPLPVAKVDDNWVSYSDYLLRLRSAIHYLSTKEAVNFNSDDGKRQLDYQKRLAMDKAIENAYVERLAKDNDIKVSAQEVDDFIRRQISTYHLGVTPEVYRQVIRDYYDWSFDEYQDSISQQLLRKKVSARLDDAAKRKIVTLLQQLKKGADFAKLAKAQSEDLTTKSQGGDWGVVSKDTDDPSGLINIASGLEPKHFSDVIEGVDGFYIVKLVQKRDNGDLHLAKIFIAYHVVSQRLEDLKKGDRIQEFIQVIALPDPVNQ